MTNFQVGMELEYKDGVVDYTGKIVHITNDRSNIGIQWTHKNHVETYVYSSVEVWLFNGNLKILNLATTTKEPSSESKLDPLSVVLEALYDHTSKSTKFSDEVVSAYLKSYKDFTGKDKPEFMR